MDISNRTLSIFVLAALVITLVSTSLTLNEMKVVRNRLIAGYPGYTGLATGTGNVSVYIESSLNMSILNKTVFFGQGVVSTNCSNATLHTNQSNIYSGDNQSGTGASAMFRHGQTGEDITTEGAVYGEYNGTNNTNIRNCWLNTSDNGSSRGHASPILINRTGIVIRNDGNVNISVTMNSGDDGATNFLGGASPSPDYNFTVTDEESGSCPRTADGAQKPDYWTGVNSSTDQKICSNLKFQDSTDTVNITFRIRFSSSVTGQREDTLTFTSAIAAG